MTFYADGISFAGGAAKPSFSLTAKDLYDLAQLLPKLRQLSSTWQ